MPSKCARIGSTQADYAARRTAVLLKERIGDDACPVNRAVHRHGLKAVVPEVFGQALGCRRAVREQRDRGAGAGDNPGDRPQRLAESERVPEAGRQLNRGALEIVDEDPAEGIGVAGPQGLEDHRVHGSGFVDHRLFVRAQPVQGPVDLRGGQPEVRRHEDPVGLGLDEGGREVVAEAEPDGGAPEQGEGHVGAKFRGQVGELVAGKPAVPQRVTGQQGGCRVGRAAAHSSGHGHPLGDFEVDAGGVLRDVGHDRRRLVGQVAFVEGDVHAVEVQGAGRADADGYFPGVRAGGGDFFVEGHREVDAGHRVVAVRAQGPHIQ